MQSQPRQIAVRDTFADERLPLADEWPEFDLSHPGYQFPERLNCVETLLDTWIAQGLGERRCLLTPSDEWTYRQLYQTVNRLANLLIDEMGLVPGNRVLLRAPNTPMMVAGYLAIMKAGGIAVGTMPMLRVPELRAVLDKAQVSHVLCDIRLREALDEAVRQSPSVRETAYFQTDAPEGVEQRLARHSDDFLAYDAPADQTCLIAFTSGTTGVPKGTMHFHRDLIAICRGFGEGILRPRSDDLFCGSPPLAFTFGLGGLALFPLFAGAATLLLERADPISLLQAIERHQATIVFTAPTAYRAMLGELDHYDISSLRKGVSAGEHLPEPTWRAFKEKTGIALIDGIGSTEMLHVFISAREEEIRPGSTGRPVPGYQARIVDERGAELPMGEVGRLAVKGPTGCRYLDDPRQSKYVQDGWNLTGDTFRRDADGYYYYVARSDDMIISSGYNIAGPEVEEALLAHPAVAECGVIGTADPDRGQIVTAYVVAAPGFVPDSALAEVLQRHVKDTIAPYKYPRAIVFAESLPRTPTGKLQRHRLRQGE